MFCCGRGEPLLDGWDLPILRRLLDTKGPPASLQPRVGSVLSECTFVSAGLFSSGDTRAKQLVSSLKRTRLTLAIMDVIGRYS